MLGGLGGPWGSNPPPPPPPPAPHTFPSSPTCASSSPPMMPPPYWSGLTSPSPGYLPIPLLPSSLPPHPSPHPLPTSPHLPRLSNPTMAPIKSSKDCSDFLQQALDTVAQAQTNVARADTNTGIRACGLRGVKRKGLATDLLSSKAGSHHLNWVSNWNTEMPSELLSQCKPLHCELCNCQATSPVQAKMHYEGKTHDKHVRNFFVARNEPLPQKLAVSSPSLGGPRPSGLYCSTCHLGFTSFSQVEQHLAGKNHLRLSNGLPGLKPGYFNKELGKWQRNPIGEEPLLPFPEDKSQDSCPPPPTLSSPSTSQTTSSNDKLYCHLCKVGAPSQSQMDMHLNGKNHKAKMKRFLTEVDIGDLDTIKQKVEQKESVLGGWSKPGTGPANLHSEVRRTDYSQHRTPSGQYYCAPCNLSLNSDNQFGQHQASKKHKQKESLHRAKR